MKNLGNLTECFLRARQNKPLMKLVLMVKRYLLSNVSIVIATLIVLYSSMPYFVWHLTVIKPFLILSFVLLRFLLLRGTIPLKFQFSLFISFVLWLYLYVYHAVEISETLTTVVTRLLPILFVILFSQKEKQLLLNCLSNIFAFITAFSLLFYVLWIIGIDLPYSMLEHSDSFYGNFRNYYFFVINNDFGILTRFQGVFTEPGHLGMFAAFLLYLNLYNWRKWQCWIFLVSILWSFSLAAYVLLVVGFTIYKITVARNIVLAIARSFLVILILIVSSVIYYFSFPDSLVSIFILSRLEVDKEQGVTGNNRNDAQFMRYYEKIQKRSEYFVGIGTEKYYDIFKSGGNSSYRVFIVQYGLVGLFLLLLFGICVVSSTPSNLYWGLLLFYCISFVQRPYALWEIELFPFICFSSVCRSYYLKRS